MIGSDDRPESCPVCRSSATAVHRQINGYQVLRCRECRLVWTSEPTSTALADLYSENYFRGGHTFGYVDYVDSEQNHRRNAQQILQHLQLQSSSHGRLLDVGCAHGFFVDEARRIGWDAEGVEPAPAAANYARNTLGLTVFNGPLERAARADASFDVVTAIGTIEHMADPTAFIKEARRILKPNGLLVLTTVDTAGPIPVFRLKPPEHLYYFSHANLEHLLDGNGFTAIDTAWYWVHYSLAHFLHLLSLLLVGSRFTPRSLFASKSLRSLNLKMPTNEMIVIARKTTKSEVTGPSVSLIVPALNEEGNLEQTIAAVVAEIDGRVDRFEILIFDDASTDRTGAIADALSAPRPEIRVVHNPRTRGLGYSYRAGVEAATCDYVVMVPGDNEVTRAALAAMFDSIGTADIIAPYFTNSWIRPQGRQKLSRLFTRLVNRIVGAKLRYFNGPCIHRRDLALAAMPATDGFAYMAVLLGRLMASGFSVRQIGVPLGERASGGSKAFRVKNVVSVVVSLVGLFVELRLLRRRWGTPTIVSSTATRG